MNATVDSARAEDLALQRLYHWERTTPDKVIPEIQQFGGTVLQSSLDNDAETRLREALEGQGATA